MQVEETPLLYKYFKLYVKHTLGKNNLINLCTINIYGVCMNIKENRVLIDFNTYKMITDVKIDKFKDENILNIEINKNYEISFTLNYDVELNEN